MTIEVGVGRGQGAIFGKHIYGNLYGVDPALLSDEKFLRGIVIRAAELANVHVVDVRSWKFSGSDKGGVSVIALIVESHIALHTWPQHRFATVDVYTCGEHSMPERAFNYIVESLRPERYTMHYADRSSLA